MKAIGRESVDAPDPGGFIAHLAGPKPGAGGGSSICGSPKMPPNAFYSSEQFRPVMAGAESAGITTLPG